MPSKKNKNPKRTSDDTDDSANQIDVQYNPDIVAGLLQELGEQVESKCTQITTDTDFIILQMQQLFQIELLKLPTQIKKMSLTEFKKQYGDSSDLILKPPKPASFDGKFRQPHSIAPSNSNNNQSKVFQTPMMSKENDPRFIRAPKEGEKIISTNGSPLGEFTTAQKAMKNSNDTIIPQTPGVFVPLKSGAILDLSNLNNVDMAGLDPSLKEDALLKMKAMMENMQMLMGKLQA